MGLKGYQVNKSACLLWNVQHNVSANSCTLFVSLDYRMGKTKVFLRAGQMVELNARRVEVLGDVA